MGEHELKRIARLLVICMLCVVSTLLLISRFDVLANLYHAEEHVKDEMKYSDFNRYKKILTNGITIPRAKSSGNFTPEIQEDAIHKRIILTFPVEYEEFFKNLSYDAPIQKVKVDTILNSLGEESIQVDLSFDDVYCCEWMVDKEYVNLKFEKPQKIYDKVVVIDPGHGSEDSPGAVWGDVQEKDLIYSVYGYLRSEMDLMVKKSDLKVFYTRTDDSNVSLEERYILANAVEADLFLSIHMNTYIDSTAIKGAETYYNDDEVDGEAFAKILQDNLVNTMDMNDRGILDGKGYRIIRYAQVPTVLAELGFLSNDEDREKLLDATSQQKYAKVISRSIEFYLEN